MVEPTHAHTVLGTTSPASPPGQRWNFTVQRPGNCVKQFWSDPCVDRSSFPLLPFLESSLIYPSLIRCAIHTTTPLLKLIKASHNSWFQAAYRCPRHLQNIICPVFCWSPRRMGSGLHVCWLHQRGIPSGSWRWRQVVGWGYKLGLPIWAVTDVFLRSLWLVSSSYPEGHGREKRALVRDLRGTPLQFRSQFSHLLGEQGLHYIA